MHYSSNPVLRTGSKSEHLCRKALKRKNMSKMYRYHTVSKERDSHQERTRVEGGKKKDKGYKSCHVLITSPRLRANQISGICTCVAPTSSLHIHLDDAKLYSPSRNPTAYHLASR